jgi:hypothetical protein
MSDTHRMLSARRCQYENPNLPKYIVPYDEAIQVEIELNQCRRELAADRQELGEWKTLQSWGGTPQIVDEFIKGQQSRIHAAQEAEKQRDMLAEACRLLMKIIGPLESPAWATDDEIDYAYNAGEQALAAVKGGEA